MWDPRDLLSCWKVVPGCRRTRVSLRGMGRNDKAQARGEATMKMACKRAWQQEWMESGHKKSSENVHWFELLKSEFTLCYLSLSLIFLWEIMRNRVCGEMLISFQQLVCSKINKGVYAEEKRDNMNQKWQDQYYTQVPLFLPADKSSW